MTSFDEDFAWQEKFRAHYSEIAKLAVRVDVAPAEEDWKRNTDFVLSTVIALPRRDIRISARVRRRKFASSGRRDFTIRLSRPSGVRTEMAKLRDGWSDLFIYGVEAETGSDRLGPWFVGNSAMLRDYLNHGGFYATRNNHDGSSSLAVVNHDDMPLGFVLASDGVPEYDRDAVWGRCRRCYWNQVAPMDEEWRLGDGYWRKCLACGFQWRAGWPMSLVAA